MKTRIFSAPLLAALCCLLSTTLSFAQSAISASDIPRTISYQGLLTNNDGSPLPDGQYQITVSLHSSPGGADILWKDTYLTSVNNGIFNIIIGAGSKPLPDPSTMNTPLWIGTQVGDSPEMYPLTPLSASPYALNVSDNAITTGKLADAAVTAEKVDMNYISAVEINDRKVSGVGTVLKLKSSDEITLNYDETTNSVTIASNAASKNSSAGDPEKGGKVLDAVIGTENWLGRNTGLNQPSFGAPLGTYNTLGAGYANTIGAECNYSTIAGGQENSIDHNSDHNMIGGGETNTISSYNSWATIAGGFENSSTVDLTFIGGGYSNSNSGYAGTIGGGWDNTLSGYNGFLGGGVSNNVSGDQASLGGGDANWSAGNQSTIGGGYSNHASGQTATITGGYDNTASGDYSTVGGGLTNIASGERAIIAGGFNNTASAKSTTVAGGAFNTASLLYASVGGGYGSTASGEFSTIAGGRLNVASGDYSSVSGGYTNVAGGNNSTIPGGDHLETTSYGQTAVGFYNAPRGSLTGQPVVFTLPDDPLFMVGNGPFPVSGPAIHSNAFEVSYNGHSVVYDVNGTSQAAILNSRVPFEGASYVDNILCSWADINANGTINSDFGVISVAHIPGSGIYDVRIQLIDPQTGNLVILNNASITATVSDESEATPAPCTFITASRVGSVGPNVFRIRTRNINCQPVDVPFMFKVTGRR